MASDAGLQLVRNVAKFDGEVIESSWKGLQVKDINWVMHEEVNGSGAQ